MKFNISPKLGMAIGAATAVLGALMACTTQFTTLFGGGTANKVMAGISIGFIGLGALHTFLFAGASTEPGPLSPDKK